MATRRGLLAGFGALAGWLALPRPSVAEPGSDGSDGSGSGWPHGGPLVSVALRPDGRVLATGAEAPPEHADDPVDGVVLWDVRSGAVRARIPIPGGVGLADQLRGGIRFAADGERLAINGHTNGLFTATASKVLAAHYLTMNDGPPQAVLSDDGARLFVEDYVQQRLGGVVPTDRTVPDGAVAWLPRGPGAPIHPLRLENEALLVLEAGSLRRYPLTGAASVDGPMLLARGHRRAARRGDVVAAAGDGVVLWDLARERAIVTVADQPHVEDFAFAAAAPRALAFVQRTSGPGATRVILLDGGGPRPIPRDLGRIDWLGFRDGLPGALSADGRRALLVGADGTVERWRLDPEPAREAELGRWSEVQGVVWAQADRAVLVGPRKLVFLDPLGGAVVRAVTAAP